MSAKPDIGHTTCRSCAAGPGRRREDGYTLAELLVVLVILALLAAILTPQILGQMERAKVRAARLQADGLLTAVELMAADTGRLPTTQEGLKVLVEVNGDVPGWQGPYIRDAKRLIDPWGRQFQIEVPSRSGRDFAIVCLGADGKVEGERSAADIIVE